ncbi:hypothetical protein H4582DRAFT_2018598 [Lactarius indigo]|nr:hypothetical protein H4582DRAFT_2018598 [Lactarius indigo]
MWHIPRVAGLCLVIGTVFFFFFSKCTMAKIVLLSCHRPQRKACLCVIYPLFRMATYWHTSMRNCKCSIDTFAGTYGGLDISAIY